jgi:Fic family protein
MPAPVKYHEGGFPPASLDWASLIPLIGPANASLARFDGMLAAVPNPGVLLSPLATQEAVLSSRIEGTQATMGEVLEFEAGGDKDAVSDQRKGDIQEVLNYRNALQNAETMLGKMPLCQRILREAHTTLLQGVRGQGKAPGEFRRIANWIGPPGCSIEEAKFIPISAENLPKAMSRWERYIHEDSPDHLVQLAILHAEFEALHPFLDGNGRLGRMFVPLFLHGKGLLRRPVFYISEYLEANRDSYYDRLLAVSKNGDWTGWSRFFLQAITAQADANVSRTRAILDLYQAKKEDVAEATRSQHAIKALDFFFMSPIFSTSLFMKKTGIPSATSNRIIKALLGRRVFAVLREGSGRRPAVYAFRELLNIAEGSEVF